MPIPKSARVIYQNNPLEEVICQLRFPPILRIDTEAPAKFQERIRKDYPAFKDAQTQDFGFQGAQMPVDVTNLLRSQFFQKTAYEFISSDELWKVSLTREFVALSARQYTRWEDFKGRLKAIVASLTEEYSPAFLTRLGLRYRDVIRKSKLGLESVGWSDLLQPHVLGNLSSPDVAPDIDSIGHEVLIRLDAMGGLVRLQHGLVKGTKPEETCYVIDSDFFTEKRTEMKDAFTALDAFNGQAGNLFRWCITPRLQAAMEPRTV
jgi:uncharacterized protein (TIGR04255 family)